MKFFRVVVFALTIGDADRDLYIFTDPTFDNKDICEASITDPQYFPSLVQKLVMEYKQIKSIDAVVCVEEEELRNALAGARNV